MLSPPWLASFLGSMNVRLGVGEKLAGLVVVTVCNQLSEVQHVWLLQFWLSVQCARISTPLPIVTTGSTLIEPTCTMAALAAEPAMATVIAARVIEPVRPALAIAIAMMDLSLLSAARFGARPRSTRVPRGG